MFKDHNKIQVDDIIVQNIDNTCNRYQVQDISHYTTSSNTCNYRLPATNINKRNEINVSPKQAWKLKVEEFCHKHKTCLICDLNVNNQDVEHLLIYKKKLNFLGYLITWVVKFL